MTNRMNEEADVIAVSKVYQGNNLTGRTPSMVYRNGLIENLLSALENRFPSSDIIVASTISSFHNWPCPEDKEAIIGCC